MTIATINRFISLFTKAFDDFIAVVTGEGNLAGSGEVQLIGWQVVDLIRVGTEESGTGHDLWLNQGWGDERSKTGR